MDATIVRTCPECGAVKAWSAFYQNHARCKACYIVWQTAYNRATRGRDRIKRHARALLNSALARGTITRPLACVECLTPRTPHGHHTDYSKPLEVLWVCRPCHMRKHKNNLRKSA